MKQLLKFLSLSSADRLLLLKSVFLLGVIRLGLFLLPFKTLLRFFPQDIVLPHKMNSSKMCSDRIAWAVKKSSRYMPITTCLTQALAVHRLLAHQGCPTQLRIGVTKNDQGWLEAHAWVENQGKIVIGDLKDLSRYHLLPPFSS